MRLRPKQIAIGVITAGLLILLFVWSNRTQVPPSPQPEITRIERAAPQSAYPEGNRTPGFTNPDISQENIAETICNPEWSTRTIRPPLSYTAKLKRQQMQAWGLPGTTADYEEDHFISLELGGHPTDPRNLWPEPYHPKPGAKEKDVVENYLHKEVCSGAMTLEEAQRAIVTDWYQVYLRIHP